MARRSSRSDGYPLSYEVEKELVRDCLDWFLLQGIPAWRNQSGFVFLPGGKNTKGRMIRMGQIGGSDIIACLPTKGTLLAVECKVKNRKQTDDQCKFQVAIEKAGGRYLLVRSVPELDRALSC